MAKKIKKELRVKDKKELNFFTNRAVESNNSKRVIIFRAISKLSLGSKSRLLDIPETLKRAGYEKEDLFVADSLANKLSRDIPILNKSLRGLKVRNSKSKIVGDKKNPVITELELSVIKE